jgi:hypothetical protein
MSTQTNLGGLPFFRNIACKLSVRSLPSFYVYDLQTQP